MILIVDVAFILRVNHYKSFACLFVYFIFITLICRGSRALICNNWEFCSFQVPYGLRGNL